MTLHKLSAGGGYTYLTTQVARLDAQGVRGGDLGGYYSGKGETPGRWLGAGLAGLSQSPDAPGLRAGDVVTEVQMLALFGEGRHPQDKEIQRAQVARGAGSEIAERAGRLGRSFPAMAPLGEFRTRCAQEYAAAGCIRPSPSDEEQRAVIRTQVATAMFVRDLVRPPVDGRELNGFIIRSTRRTAPVAGYDLTFSPVKSVSTLWALAPLPTARVIEAAHDAAVRDTLAWLESRACFTRLGRGGVRQVETTGLLATAFTHRDTRAGDPDLHTHVAISNKVQTTPANGSRWLALDGRVLHKAAVAASERYNTRLEAELRDRLGVAFAERAESFESGLMANRGARSKRIIREIVGVDPALMRAWSSRRAAIDVARARLEQQFQARHGRPPTPAESIKLAQEANLATRAAKHEPRAEAEQRTQWRAQALEVLAGGRTDRAARRSAVAEVDQMVEHVQQRSRVLRGPSATATEVAASQWVEDAARAVIEAVQSSRATWQQWHVIAETQRVIRTANIPLVHQARVERLVLAAALGRGHSVPLACHPDPSPSHPGAPSQAVAPAPAADAGAHRLAAAVVATSSTARATSTRNVLPLLRSDPLDDPAALRRSDGESVYEVAGMTFFTSAAVLAAEQRIVDLAGQRGAHAVSEADVDLALLESSAHGRDLNPAQAAMVLAFATSGARVQLAIAPAGTGKTTATAVLASAWRNGGGTVLGLAPTAAAAAVLGQETDSDCDTLAKLVWAVRAAHPDQPNQAGPQDGPHRPSLPGWAYEVGPRTLVIVDEAGMASTTDLDVALGWLTSRGAVVRLIGDDQQLASVSCGGVLRDVATAHGALTLSELIRFADPAEGSASLAARAGDHTAIGFWLDNDRVSIGGAQTMIETTYRQWADDVAAGLDSVMLAPRRDIVATLNAQARTQRLAALTTDGLTSDSVPLGREVLLSDGNTASAGDTVITRRNARDLPISATDYVRNGYRWTIQTVHDDGSVTVGSIRTQTPTTAVSMSSAAAGSRRAAVRLPAGYVAEHLELGYATTIHGAQGVTADRCRLLADDTLDRQLLYVGTTRGRQLNSISLIVVGDGDPHDQSTPAAVHPDTATEILEAIVARDGSQVSATTRLRDAASPRHRLAPAAARYHDALGMAAQDVADPTVMATLDQHVDAHHPGLQDDPSWPVLRARLAVLHLQGRDPVAAIEDAAGPPSTGGTSSTGRRRSLVDARDAAAVLDWRLNELHVNSHSNQGQEGKQGLVAGEGISAPLPWLPGVPTVLAAHTQWGPYLHARADWVTTQTEGVLAEVAEWTADSAPVWVGNLGLAHDDPVVRRLAVWRYAHAVEDQDVRATGPARFDVTTARHQHQLERDIRTAGGHSPGRSSALFEFVAGIEPRIVTDPTWRAVEVRLHGLARAGVNVPAAIRTALHGASTDDPLGPPRALPDDMPAAALWWRISQHTDPAVLAGHAPAYRPPWFQILVHDFGLRRADRVVNDPAWSAVLAAVNLAQRSGLDPDAVVHVAAQMAEPDRPPTHGGIADADMARALSVRITALTQHAEITFTTDRLRRGAPSSLTRSGAAGPAEGDEHDTTSGWDEPPLAEDAPAPPPDPTLAGGEPDLEWAPDAVATEAVSRGHVHDESETSEANELAAQGTSQFDSCLAAMHRPSSGYDLDEAWDDPAQLRRFLDEAAADRQTVDRLLRQLSASGAADVPGTDPTRRAGATAAGVSRERLLHLNRSAAQFFTAQLPGSWAQTYVLDRLCLGAGSVVPQGFGYAPPGWDTLTVHLRRHHGATADELIEVGLSKMSSRGILVDVFRDRVVRPLIEPAPDPAPGLGLSADRTSTVVRPVSDVVVVGFVGRRNPGRDDDQHAGPKYLNTRSTSLYNKRTHLLGLTDLAAAGATAATPAAPSHGNATKLVYADLEKLLEVQPAQRSQTGWQPLDEVRLVVPVLVEGMFDAAAVTVAGRGRYVGVAALGTSLTPAHVAGLTATLPEGSRVRDVVVGTDADKAGNQAALSAYQLLTETGARPTRLLLPDGADPADVLARSGPDALYSLLQAAPPMASTLIERLACEPEASVEQQVAAMRRAAAIITALPSWNWQHGMQDAIGATGVTLECALSVMVESARSANNDRWERWNTLVRLSTQRAAHAQSLQSPGSVEDRLSPRSVSARVGDATEHWRRTTTRAHSSTTSVAGQPRRSL